MILTKGNEGNEEGTKLKERTEMGIRKGDKGGKGAAEEVGWNRFGRGWKPGETAWKPPETVARGARELRGRGGKEREGAEKGWVQEWGVPAGGTSNCMLCRVYTVLASQFFCGKIDSLNED
jgi:hypothetical protein